MTTESELQHAFRLFFSDLDLCGCGEPEQSFMVVFRILISTPRPGGEDAFNAGRYSWLGTYAVGVSQVILSMLTTADLVEHGTGIGGSWLTPKGTYYRAVLGRLNVDEVMGAGLPHDGDECTDACWALTEEQLRVAPGPILPGQGYAFDPQSRLPPNPNSAAPAGLTAEMINRAFGINEPRIEVPDKIPSEWVTPLRDEADRLPRGRNPYIGCREVGGTWIHGRPHSCPVSARGF